MRRILSSFVALALLTGCASRYHADGSFVGNLPQGTAQSIAADAAGALAILYPPGHTSVSLVVPKNRDDFSQALENYLRTKGFTLSPSGAAVTVAYVLDELRSEKPPSWYLRLRIADLQGSKTLTRAYTATGQPAAGFSGILTGGVTEGR